MALLPSFGLCLLGLVVLNPFLAAGRCPRDWLHHRGDCYGYFDAQKSWDDAVIECQTYGRGSYLASVLSPAETDLVAKYISRYQKGAKDVWIGLSDLEQYRVWRWADGSSFNYDAWNYGEPNNARGNEYCVELLQGTGFKKWNDDPCEEQNAYICKYSLEEKVPNQAPDLHGDIGVQVSGSDILEDGSPTS